MHGVHELIELLTVFDTEQKCIEHLAKVRWPNGVVCPKCGCFGHISYVESRRVWWCGDCRKQFSVRIGTIFEESRLPLRKWFAAIWLATSRKKGISSVQLAKDIGVTQKSAWFVLGRIREVMAEMGDRGYLFGVVEVDDAYIGGKERNKHASKRTPGTQGRRSAKTKSAVIGMVERGGQVRAFNVPNLRGDAARVAVGSNVLPGSMIGSDELGSYGLLVDERYPRDTVSHGADEYVRGAVHTNTIEGCWSLFRRGIIGIYHHCSDKHLQRYLDEFCARANTRWRSESGRVNRLLARSVGLRLTYEDLIGDAP